MEKKRCSEIFRVRFKLNLAIGNSLTNLLFMPLIKKNAYSYL